MFTFVLGTGSKTVERLCCWSWSSRYRNPGSGAGVETSGKVCPQREGDSLTLGEGRRKAE